MLESTAFSVHLAIDRNPLTVTPDTPVSSAIVLMSQIKSSCAIIVEADKILGIFTERDVVKLTAQSGDREIEPFTKAFSKQPISALMTPRPFILQEEHLPNLVNLLDLLRQKQIRHLPIVDPDEKLLGTITYQSIREIIQPADWMRLRRVVEVMNPKVITASPSASVFELATLMNIHRVSCVAIAQNRPRDDAKRTSELPPLPIPIGIVTERDILQLQALELNLRKLTAADVMSSPLLLVQPTDCLWTAHRLMREYRVRRLIVADQGEGLQGIITQTSLLQGCTPIEIDAAIAALQGLVEERTTELQQANEHLRREILERQHTEAALRLSQARLAGVLDSADDAIISIDETHRIQLFNQGAEKIFGYSAAEVMGQPLDLLLPENLRQKHRQYIENFRYTPEVSRTMGTRSQVFGRRKDGSQFPAEASISKLEVGSERLFTVILRDITSRVEAQEALQLQLEREQVMSAMRDRIRSSLNLQEILNTTVAEVRQFLNTDRVIIYRFYPDWSGKIVVESCSNGVREILNLTILDPCFGETHAELYKKGRLKATADIYTEPISPCHRNLLTQFQVKANLVVPILLNEDLQAHSEEDWVENSSGNNNQLWGLLIAHHCQGPRQWQNWETEFLQQLATQVAIAIQQSTLFEQLQAANQELHRLASLDGLTQVANRRCFDEFFNHEWRREAQDPLSLILCDIDYFKPYNDTYGHQAGDECLQRVAAALRQCINPKIELIARYGGEEFAAVLPNTDLKNALELAERIRTQVAALQIPHTKSPVSPYITMSVGVATLIPTPETTPAQLIANADEALYVAKAGGRNRVVCA
ncbi:diguanylate cyclase domain-containing protein [Laspinema olomoucense]|uniref:Diguanylate cyclase n=1 Tax=Laspinema olomoucense D3b TaxID=2953688 RepID=A0ABT2N4D1_9CYAN|nr:MULTISPECIES: diguanylate cyclase [unclassified Laspinema]MCT7976250.1 diguanylate cyclase [Laspinema sp. D3b]MCT7989998.1 diguanylate cyclase [Laspinema sp. D3a]MCT7995754.1 diguanylate cyclase [Laspinema sp. D3c]